MDIKSEPAPIYSGNKEAESLNDDAIIDLAIEIIKDRWNSGGAVLTNPKQTTDYLTVLLGKYDYEIFGMLSLSNRNQIIGFDEIFKGTIDGCAVYPREVVKTALKRGAAAVIFAHNHPSGVSEPSQADINLTERLKKALALIDIRTLDHIVVGDTCTSLAEQGLM